MSFKCTNPWTSLFVWKNGDVTHCCYSNAGPLGNIYHHSMDEIWHSEKLSGIRKSIAEGKYEQAGCEYYCRPFRWHRIYQNEDHPIPEGLGRLSDVDSNHPSSTPKIVATEFDGHCNMTCNHCLGSHHMTKGLPDQGVAMVYPWIEKAEIIRVMGGEFSANPRNLGFISGISEKEKQPTVFLNTNGKIPLTDYWDAIKELQSLHMKFSLEGMGEDYEAIRNGNSWTNFRTNLIEAKIIFSKKRHSNKDWRLYMNYCVMYSNFAKIPEVLDFAVKQDIPLVINTINGMRHRDENMFMFPELTLSKEALDKTTDSIKKILMTSDYCFEKEFLSHYDYILKAYELPKLRIRQVWLDRITHRFGGLKTDRILYILYRWQQSSYYTVMYLLRKLRKKLIKP